MSFYTGKKDPTEKFKKEIKALLTRPHRSDGAKGIMITREEMALFRVEQLFEQIYKKLRKEYKDEMKAGRITKRKLKKKLHLTTPELITKGINLLTPEEKEKIYTSQQKILLKVDPETIPPHFLLTEEQINIPIDDSFDVKELITITPEDIIGQQTNLLSKKPRKKRKPSARNIFIGKMMSATKISMKQASDMWRDMPKEHQEAYKSD